MTGEYTTGIGKGKPRILILITQMERAGAQKIAITLAHYFHREGFVVTLGFFYDKYALLSDLRQSCPFPILNLDAKEPHGKRFTNAWQTIRAIWRLYYYLKTEKIDLVVTFTHYSNLIGIPIAWLARVAIRISSQRNALNDFPKWFHKLDALIVNSALTDCMIAVSEQTRQYCIHVEGMNADKVFTVINGISPTKFQAYATNLATKIEARTEFNIPLTSPVLITVARLHPQKGYPSLIEAATRILDSFPDAIFVLVGDGPERNAITELISASGNEMSFRLLGARADIPRLLGMSNIFVLPSRYEGMPNVLLEAMAAQLPVVATRVDGAVEVVCDGITGYLVPPEDAVSLADAVCKLLADPATQANFGHQGFERVVEHFSEAIMCKRYEDIFIHFFKTKLPGRIVNE